MALDENELRLPDAKTGARVVPLVALGGEASFRSAAHGPGNPWVIPGPEAGHAYERPR